ncbi:MAG: chromate efflux transporter [Rhodospirillales bacterium]|nr:chromate efflux transporter [Rhodospirillales bacterium]
MAVQTPASVLSVFRVFLRLGAICFGGPVAHFGYYRDEFVVRRGWLDDREFADLTALCQFLPGPASSQFGIAVGIKRAGLAGGLAAWLGFTLPSAAIMVGFGYGLVNLGDAVGTGWLQGLRIMAVAVVARAVWGMGLTLCPDARRAALALLAAILVVLWPSLTGGAPGAQFAAIVAGGILGRLIVPTENESPRPLDFAPGRRTGAAAWILFFALLALLPALGWLGVHPLVGVADAFYRSGALVFGGGHVVLPLLQAEVVPRGWVGNEVFLAGYGAAQALPGPIFTFAGYLGAMMDAGAAPWVTALVALIAIFLPAHLLVIGALPFWDALRSRARVRAALAGVTAAVVGLLLAVLYDPLWTETVRTPVDFAFALGIFGLLVFAKVPPPVLAVAAALLGIGAALL